MEISIIFEMRWAKQQITNVIVSKLNIIIKVTNILNREEYNNQIIIREIIGSTVKRTAENDLYIKLNKFIHYELRNTDDFITNLSI